MFRSLKVLAFVPIVLLFVVMTSPSAAPAELAHAQVEGPDGDLDGVLDEADVCLGSPPGEAVNEEGCSIGELCPCIGGWKNHGEFASCVTQTSQDFVKAGWITNEDKGVYVSEAARLECPMQVGGANYSDYGIPHPPPVWKADDTLEITFAVTGDPQLENMYDSKYFAPFCGDHPTDKLLASQITAREINAACKSADPGCLGVVVAGDLTQRTCVQEIVAFRQIFEYDYPGEDGGAIACHRDDYDNRYSWDNTLGYPMFPMIGNHDDPSECDPDCSCFDYCLGCGDLTCHTTFVGDYIKDLVRGSDLYRFPIEKRVSGAVPYSGYRDNYAWEWGSFHFINLGLWAFYDEFDHDARNRYKVNQGKIEWLKSYLEAVGHEKAILLFQHFGANELDGKWWSSNNLRQLVNVLCNRDSWDQPCGTEERPRYNVIGIFSGHSHLVDYRQICAEADSSGGCLVEFDNYIVNDAGPQSNHEGTGYTMVHLNLWPEGYDRHTENQMTVTNINLDIADLRLWNYDGSGAGTNDANYSLVTHSTHTKTGITSGLATWDQREPNGGRWENCATMKSNGRFNDAYCHQSLRYVCRDMATHELHLLTTGDAGAWHHGEFVCEESGGDRVFSLPKSIAEQAHLMQLIIDSQDTSPVWVNYSDQIEEDHWISYPQDYFYFVEGQPNDGSQLLLDKGHGEDCALINEDGQLEYGLLQDGRCENEMHTYVCSKDEKWYLHTEKGMWKQAFDDDKCGEHGFLFPADLHEFEDMYQTLQPQLKAYGKAWIGLDDIVKEGDWVSTNSDEQCWGSNENGQATLPSRAFRQISAGHDFTCGIRLDGTVICRGDNTYGQLDAPASDIFLQISAATRHVCGVRSDKTVVCWGTDYFGETNPPAGKFHQVSAGDVHTCGIRNDHSVTCWGGNDLGQSDAPSGKFRQISAGGYHTCGVRFNDNVACWGRAVEGQSDAPSGTFIQVSAGELHTCGVRDALTQPPFEGYWKLDEGTGKLAADSSGNDYDGTLGNSPTWSTDTAHGHFDNTSSLQFDRADSDYVSIPRTTNIDNLSELSLSTWVKLTSTPSAASSHTNMRFINLGNEKAVLRYHDYDGTGQLQFYMMNIGGILVDAPWETGVWYHVVGTYDGSTMRLYRDGVEMAKVSVSGSVLMGDGVSLSSWTAAESLDGLLDDVQIYSRALSLGEIHALAAGDHPDSKGSLECWGENGQGQVDSPVGHFLTIDAGAWHTCGVRSNGTLACWGDNRWGQSHAPTGTSDDVSAGGYHTCSIDNFIHPWEDDFAPGEKLNEGEDCAYLHTYMEGGRLRGQWYDLPCNLRIQNAACRSVATGDWQVTPDFWRPWSGGFDRCHEEFGRDYRFDAPATRAENKQLIEQVWAQFGAPRDVWLNYTDARSEGLWRHEYWQDWREGDPIPGDGHCAMLDRVDSNWWQVECYGPGGYAICEKGDGTYEVSDFLFGWYDHALAYCAERNSVLALPGSEHDETEMTHWLPSIQEKFWIRFTDANTPGQWEDWAYDD